MHHSILTNGFYVNGTVNIAKKGDYRFSFHCDKQKDSFGTSPSKKCLIVYIKPVKKPIIMFTHAGCDLDCDVCTYKTLS